MKGKARQSWLLAVGLLLTGLAVAWLIVHLRGHWDDLWRGFRRADYAYVVPAVALLAVMYVLRVLRWRVFLSPIKPVPYSTIASATCIGFMSSCLLPLRPGEVIRPYVLSRKAGISFGHAAGTAMGLERIFDLFGICFLLLLAWILLLASAGPAAGSSPLGPSPAATVADAEAPAADGAGTGNVLEQVRASSAWFLLVTAVGMCALIALAFFPSQVLRISGFFLRVLPVGWRQTLLAFLGSMAHAVGFLKKPTHVLAALAISFAQWFCFPVSTYCLARGFGLDLSLTGALVVQVFLTAAVAAPQAPGFIGVFQWAAITGVRFCTPGAWDTQTSMTTTAFAMMLWAINVIPITLVGLAVLRMEGLGLHRLARMSREAAARQDEDEGEPPES